MMMVEEKNTQDLSFVLGQYFTPSEICDQIVSRLDLSNATAVEPSFGTGAVIRAMQDKAIKVMRKRFAAFDTRWHVPEGGGL